MLAPTFVASFALVVSLVTSAYVVSQAYVARGESQDRAARTLDVTGSARARITSDLAQWTIRVAGEAPAMQDSYLKLTSAVDAVRAFLAAEGFTGGIELAPIETVVHHAYDAKGHATREVLAIQLMRRIEVTAKEPARVAAAAGRVTELIKAGHDVRSEAPRYTYTKVSDRKIEMIAAATANARERAERIAAESRCRLGAVKDARAGPLQITTPDSTDVSSSGIYDTATIEKDIASTVRLSFAIE